MRPVVINGPAATGPSNPVILDLFLAPQAVGLAVQFTAGASATAKVQYSLDDPFATYATDYNTNAIWYDHATLASLTSNTAGTLLFPVRAVRLNNTVYSSGTTSLTVVQVGGLA